MGIKKPAIITLTAAAVIVIGGGVAAAAAVANSTSAGSAASTIPTVRAAVAAPSDESPTPTATPDPSAKLAAGEVCDPHNLNDTICAAFYPDLAVLNMTLSPRVGEPLASLPDAQRVALAHQACDQLDNGAGMHGVNLIATSPDDAALGRDNNSSLAAAGALAYCPEHLESADIKWTLDEYKSMGEEAAKASFAGGVVVHR